MSDTLYYGWILREDAKGTSEHASQSMQEYVRVQYIRTDGTDQGPAGKTDTYYVTESKSEHQPDAMSSSMTDHTRPRYQ